MFSARNKLNFCILEVKAWVPSQASLLTFVVDKMALGQVSVLVLHISHESFHECSKLVIPLLSKGQLYEVRQLSKKAMPFGYWGPLDRKVRRAFGNNLDKGCSSATNKL